jgi:toxin ParE1/3/4
VTTYSVILEATASSDLRGILRYIAGTLKEPVAAKRVYYSIKEKVSALNQMSLRFPVVQDDILAIRGVRWMSAENYLVFYIINENRKKVHVLRILYNRRDWRSLL